MNEWIDGYKCRYRLVAWYNTQEELKTVIEDLVLKATEGKTLKML